MPAARGRGRAPRATSSQAFPGDVLYAVKCNPDPGGAARAVGRRRAAFRLRVVAGGPRWCAHMFPDAAIHFMHPIKARGAIREAWEQHGVRDFVLDSRRRSWRRSGMRSRRPACRARWAWSCASRCRRAGRSWICPASSARSSDDAVELLRVARGVRGDAGGQLPCRFAVPGSAGLARGAGADRAGDRARRG